MNTVVVFDLGKVLVDFDYSIAARRIAARSSLALPDMHTFLGNSPLLVQYESGSLTRQDFFEAMRKATGFLGDPKEFGEFFADIFTSIPEMVELHGKLRQRNIRTYIFSNTNDLAIEHIRRNFPFFQNFDGYILSYEIKSMKPDGPIYKAMEDLAGRRGSEIIYIDDRPENIAAGEARGWRSILHQTPEKSLATMKSFGI